MKIKQKVIFKKGIYWHDPVEEGVAQLDLRLQVMEPLKKEGIFFTNPIECRDSPVCMKENFDVLFFDWGGMSLGNSMLGHFCRYIYNHAEDHPGRFYVMVSRVTAAAMADAAKEFGKDRDNILLSIKVLKKQRLE